MASLLKKFIDADQWDAEDTTGRLCMVLHAAFLFAGFQPYGAQPRSGHLLKKRSRKKGGSLCLSRQYTAPDLAHREGADTAVLMLCAQGSDVALLVFLTTSDGDDTPENAYMERLDLGAVSPLLSRSLGGVDPWASRICKSLADGVCWGFLDELCRRNGLPPMNGFASLPDDLKGAVLEKLTDGKDLAMVECVSSQLRLLVAERDHELWRTLYQARQHRVWCLRGTKSSDEEQETLSRGSSWKDKYVELRRRYRAMLICSLGRWSYYWAVEAVEAVKARRRYRAMLTWRLGLSSYWEDKYVEARWRSRPLLFRTIELLLFFDSYDLMRMTRPRDLLSWRLVVGGGQVWRLAVRGDQVWRLAVRGGQVALIPDPPEPEEKTVPPRVDRSRRKLARNDCKKWHGGGAIHSPSSRYRWKHR